MSHAPRYTVIRDYPPRGPMHQYRLDQSVAFQCFRCGRAKKSRLVTVYSENWYTLLCNGCYGRLLSIFEIKAGSQSDEEKSEALAKLLLSLIPAHEARTALRVDRIAIRRSELMTEQALRFVGTSEYVAERLGDMSGLDWSPAVIGLCKASEVELVYRVIDPLKVLSSEVDLSPDLNDKDLGRVARYCAGRSQVAPELGSMAHFLQTAAHSKTRAATSPLIALLHRFLADRPDGQWLLADGGAVEAIQTLTTTYRNRAAHIDELSRTDYESCFDYVAGQNGLLWKVILSSRDLKETRKDTKHLQ